LWRIDKVGADDGKGISASFGPETIGDFLLEFGHSQVAFGLVVVEGNAPAGEEAQDLVAVLAQPLNEVAGWALFDAPAATRTARWRVPGEIPKLASSLSTSAVRCVEQQLVLGHADRKG